MKLPKLTPTNVGDLMTCHHRFKELHIEGHWPPMPQMDKVPWAFGKASHAVLAQVFDPNHGEVPNLDRIDVAARVAFFAQPYRDQAARQQDIGRCLNLVSSYVSLQSEEELRGTVATEKKLQWTYHHEGKQLFVVEATLDRVLVRESDPTCLVVKDVKTGSQRHDLYEACIQMLLAKRWYHEFETHVLEYDFLGADGSVDTQTITRADLTGVWPEVRDAAISVLTSDTVTKRIQPACEWCRIKDACQPQAGR